MNVVDSSGWLEYFADGPNAQFFAPAVEDPAQLIVPTISIYEVFKRVIQQVDEQAALQAIAAMQQGQVVDLTQPLALRAAPMKMLSLATTARVMPIPLPKPTAESMGPRRLTVTLLELTWRPIVLSIGPLARAFRSNSG